MKHGLLTSLLAITLVIATVFYTACSKDDEEKDTTPPTVSITTPGNDSIVSGTVDIKADASDDAGVAGVQFKLDGINLGDEIVSAPYTYLWNTATVADGDHVLTASWTIGRRSDDNAGYFNGTIYWALVYNTMLTAEQMGQIATGN